jgi:hypothetical protein
LRQHLHAPLLLLQLQTPPATGRCRSLLLWLLVRLRLLLVCCLLQAWVLRLVPWTGRC